MDRTTLLSLPHQEEATLLMAGVEEAGVVTNGFSMFRAIMRSDSSCDVVSSSLSSFSSLILPAGLAALTAAVASDVVVVVGVVGIVLVLVLLVLLVVLLLRCCCGRRK